MKKLIISFKNRDNLFNFVNILRNNRINVQIINTPHSISVSCGLSAKTNISNYNAVVSILRRINGYGLIGVYSIEYDGIKEKSERLYWLNVLFLIK